MRFVKGIIYFGSTLLIAWACKKQPIESDYLRERDNKIDTTIDRNSGSSQATELNMNPIELQATNGLPLGLNNIWGYFVCAKRSDDYYAPYFTVEYFPLDSSGSVIKLPTWPTHPTPCTFTINPSDSNHLTIEFENALKKYKLNSKRGFSKVIIDNAYRGNVGGSVTPNRPYNIQYKGSFKNTDTIINHNTYNIIPLTATVATLQSSNPHPYPGKPRKYKVIFRNFSYVTIKGKTFIILNDIDHGYEAL